VVAGQPVHRVREQHRQVLTHCALFVPSLTRNY
jgi:hypothetical protein